MPEPVTAPGRQHFRWRAIEEASGRVRSGESPGETAYEVRASLRRAGLQVEAIEPIVPAASPRWAASLIAFWRGRQRARRQLAKADLCDALATMIDAGVPLEQAAATLSSASARPPVERRLLRELRDRLREGTAFSDAIAAQPTWFDRFDAALVSSGQQSGDLSATLHSLAGIHQRAGALGHRLAAALAYPLVLFLAGIGVVVFMSVKTLPQLVTMITASHREPPWLTMQVIAFGQGLLHWWPIVFIALIALLIAGRRIVGRIGAEGRLGRLVHGNPLARLRSRSRVATLALALARLRKAGMPLVESLEIVAETVADRALRHLLAAGVAAIRRGEDLSQTIASSPVLDPEFAQLLQLGERSGELTTMLERIAERYQRAADRTADRVAALLGPLAIIVLAVLIGIIVLASVLPLAQLGETV